MALGAVVCEENIVVWLSTRTNSIFWEIPVAGILLVIFNENIKLSWVASIGDVELFGVIENWICSSSCELGGVTESDFLHEKKSHLD